MKKKNLSEMGRLKKMLFNDCLNIPEGAFQLLKEDVTKILASYLELKDGKVEMAVCENDEGFMTVAIKADAVRFKELKFLD